MKNLLMLLIIGLAAYGGYTVWNNQHNDAPAPQVAETNEQPKPATPAPTGRRFAPEGVFYVIQDFSITTDSGVRGMRTGVAVKRVRDSGAFMRVSDGQQEFDVRREFLTNDLDVVGNIAAVAQQASSQSAAPPVATPAGTQAAAPVKPEQPAQQPGPTNVAASMAAAQRRIAINKLQARRDSLTPQIAKLSATIDQYQSQPRVASTVVRNSAGNVVRLNIGNVHDDELARLRPQVAALEAELRNVEANLEQLRSQQ